MKTRASLLGLSLLAVLLLGAIPAAPASADVTGNFCPATSPPAYIGIDAYPGRCVGVYHTVYGWVEATNALTPVNKCAVVKPNSDGSGGNVGAPAVCAPGTTDAIVTFAEPGVHGYAVMINNSTNYHTGFYGSIVLYT